MAELGRVGLGGGVFALAGVSSSATNLPATNDYVLVGSERFVFHRNAASASAYGYVYTGTTIQDAIVNLNLAINTANRLWYFRPRAQVDWPKTDPAFEDDMHYDGRYYTGEGCQGGYPVLTGVSAWSGSSSGSSVVISAIQGGY